MKAVYLEDPGKIGIKDIKNPIRKKGEALIKVKSIGICGSDIGAYRGTNPLVSYPRVIGHEIAGEVIDVEENDKDIKVHDRVIIDPYVYCGNCYPCSLKRTNCCEDLKVLGVHIDGGMTELFSHPIKLMNKVPSNISWEQVPMAEPLTIALHAIHRTEVKEGEHVAIIGAGPIGLLAALAALAYRATPVLVDIVDERLEFAKKLGIKYIINSKNQNAEEVIKNITNGRMAEVVIEASGANTAIRNTIDFVSYAGRIAFTGWPKKDTLLPTGLFTKKEIDIRGSRTSAGEFPEALELISKGIIDVKPIISKVVRLDEVPESVKDLSEHPEKYLKINAVL
ncbi:L-threonine 3-dehydrogenase [Clostridium pasteurianum DSM 525 = ATCC 6013]|uniref:L-iditol 2-dehydrogenase n=1 Tax=Clostridium pasteurianum DSM 525 = ATCC 6013 TaxID=1262449 RepID=A0A0H3J5P7_CLOPA|nr:zinc-binding alcohol dehydrogenase family protein [Clostridium pasteurianum]AJA48774.1 L-threonine 3-dehydrogenase [Clostridium pasteurianum DSM 525 = ATCC 6013]AJA52762.1 L-threonine 3-dehydrogenase [Clostridium pasteurianum DSM 525 = ATCC 6013]AOZ75996.1 alcohol dehydrogenase [Clostridium pasteurianum DSM 525 = ATCC 6013]AOZ79792.1 alcohol dehydrogenase [Clostridium pasteurianum]ELP60072.1 L-threonine 3-dehydrogenase [Clostridium pasteurianum DSM 525 = ATCC 6013]